MYRREVLVALILAAVAIIIVPLVVAFRGMGSTAESAKSFGLKSVEYGFRCHENGRSLDECKTRAAAFMAGDRSFSEP